jgi:alpha/beta superfamily hydrolase
MGSWMSNAYYEQKQDAPFSAWVCMGLTGGFGRMGNVKVPVLDLYGEKDLPQVLRADWRRRMTLNGIPGSAQVMIPAADHHFTGRENQLATVIRGFVERLK